LIAQSLKAKVVGPPLMKSDPSKSSPKSESITHHQHDGKTNKTNITSDELPHGESIFLYGE
jgi:hypothetical protein